jgi:hypothetical protein
MSPEWAKPTFGLVLTKTPKNMTEIQRKNILIAEFMREKEDSISALKYHESWDWLMPVVAKIMRDERNWDLEREHMIRLSDALHIAYIGDVYEAVFGFINTLVYLKKVN